jgi:hypothetical protein
MRSSHLDLDETGPDDDDDDDDAWIGVGIRNDARDGR